DDGPRLERGDLGQRVPTDDAQLTDVRPIDVRERREAIAGKRPIEGQPVTGRDTRSWGNRAGPIWRGRRAREKPSCRKNRENVSHEIEGSTRRTYSPSAWMPTSPRGPHLRASA